MATVSPAMGVLTPQVREGILARGSFDFDPGFLDHPKKSCAGLTPQQRDRIFFHPKGGGWLKARQQAETLCGSCPVMVDCALHAMAYDDLPVGFVGGLTAKARLLLKRELGIPTRFGADLEDFIIELRRIRRDRDIPHGTQGGIDWHEKLHDPLCENCKDFKAEKRAARKREKILARRRVFEEDVA